MLKINVEKHHGVPFSLTPCSIKRDWMENTSERHAYRCFPVTQANMIGWNISFDEDVVYLWDGINDQTADHVKILKGGDHSYTGRGQASISFNTGLVFKTEENISMLTINPVNYFNKKFETISSLISTSWFDNSFPLAIQTTIPNEEVIIEAGTPLATIIPISLTSLNNTDINIVDYEDPDSIRHKANMAYGEAAAPFNQKGEWTDWYRKAVNEKGESLGKHEVSAIHLSVTDNTSSKRNGIM